MPDDYDQDVDFICEFCSKTLLFCVQQEFGQPLSTSDPLLIYGQCTVCDEVFCVVYRADLEETTLMDTGGFLT